MYIRHSIFTDSLSDVFGRIKLNKKGSRNIFFYLRKISRLCCSIVLVQSNNCHKKCIFLTQYYNIDLLIEVTFLSKKIYISLDPSDNDFSRKNKNQSCLMYIENIFCYVTKRCKTIKEYNV